jgi:hypothetical protein
MTQPTELARALRVKLAQIKLPPETGNLTRQFDNKLGILLAAIEQLRADSLGPRPDPVKVRAAMSTIATNLKEAQQAYFALKQKAFQQSGDTGRRTASAFENFDQKANELFNILSTVLKNEREMQAGIVRNIL